MKAATGGATAVGGRMAVGMAVGKRVGVLVGAGIKVGKGVGVNVHVGRLAIAVKTVGGRNVELIGAPGDVEAVAANAPSVASSSVVGVVSGAPVKVQAPMPINMRKQMTPTILTLGAFITHLNLYGYRTRCYIV